MLESEYVVLDFETTNATNYGRLANPLDNNNYIVAAGIKYKDTKPIAIYNNSSLSRNALIDIAASYLQGKKIIVGHNLKFDLLYIWETQYFKDWLQAGGQVWDTSLAEYFLTGQVAQYSKLRTLATSKYGQPERIKYIDKYFKHKVTTDAIPFDFVCFDVLEDVIDTEAIYLKQLLSAKHNKMLPFIETHMQHLLATIEMEFNGMYVDSDIAFNKMQDLNEQVLPIKLRILEIAKDYWPDKELEFKLTSSDHISCLLFGGEIKGINIVGMGVTPDEAWKAKKKEHWILV